MVLDVIHEIPGLGNVRVISRAPKTDAQQSPECAGKFTGIPVNRSLNNSARARALECKKKWVQRVSRALSANASRRPPESLAKILRNRGNSESLQAPDAPGNVSKAIVLLCNKPSIM